MYRTSSVITSRVESDVIAPSLCVLLFSHSLFIGRAGHVIMVTLVTLLFLPAFRTKSSFYRNRLLYY